MRLRSQRLVALGLAATSPCQRRRSPRRPRRPRRAWPELEGWAKLANDWPGETCRYDAGTEAPSVRLELAGERRLAHGLGRDRPARRVGLGCPPLRKRYAIAETIQGRARCPSPTRAATSGRSRCDGAGSVLQGLLAWRQGGPEQPLAEGFTARTGKRPLAQLSGEVRCARRRSGPGGGCGGCRFGSRQRPEPAAGDAGPPTRGRPVPGEHSLIVGANVVGLGLLYGANKLGKGSSEDGRRHLPPPATCHRRATLNEPVLLRGQRRLRHLLRDDHGAARPSTPPASSRRCPASPGSRATAASARTATAAAPW